MKNPPVNYKKFKPDNSTKRYKPISDACYSTLDASTNTYTWSSDMDKVQILREGIPYEAIEVVGHKINIPVKDVLQMLDLPQTTYNKKRREHALLSGRDSEFILTISELIDYGTEVFNQEKDKFQRWLRKPNIALDGNTPESLLDSMTGIQEVKNALHRLDYGNLS